MSNPNSFDPYDYDPDRHWFLDMLLRWLSGRLAGEEIFLLMLVGFTLQVACRWMHERDPQLLMVGRRVGYIAFFLILGWYLNCDRGLRNTPMRVWQSATLAWALAGVTATMAYPVRAIFLTLTSHARMMGAKAEAVRQKRLNEARHAKAERERLIHEEVRQLEETRAQAERERYAHELALQRNEEERQRREEEHLAAAEREANRQRLAPHKLEVDLAYTRKRVVIEPLMNEQRYQKYFHTFLTEDLPTDEYQRRARGLIKLIDDLAEIAPQSRKQRDPMAEVIQRFQQKKEDLMELEIDEDTREVLTMSLDEAMENALQQFLH